MDQVPDVPQQPSDVSPVPSELYIHTPPLAAVPGQALAKPEPALPEALKGRKNKELLQKPLKALTRRARAFLELLVAGKSTLEAYELAGYTGEPHSAYQLRSDLRFHLAQAIEAHGVSPSDVKIELIKLLKLPVAEQTVSVRTKLNLLKFMDKLTETQAERAPITPFLVNIQDPKSVQINEVK